MIAVKGIPLIDMLMLVDNLIDRNFQQIAAIKTGKETWRVTAEKHDDAITLDGSAVTN